RRASRTRPPTGAPRHRQSRAVVMEAPWPTDPPPATRAQPPRPAPGRPGRPDRRSATPGGTVRPAHGHASIPRPALNYAAWSYVPRLPGQFGSSEQPNLSNTPHYLLETAPFRRVACVVGHVSRATGHVNHNETTPDPEI